MARRRIPTMTELCGAAALVAHFATGCADPEDAGVARAAAFPIVDGAVDDATEAVVFVMRSFGLGGRTGSSRYRRSR